MNKDPALPQAPQQINIGTMPAGHNSSLSIKPDEHPEDRTARIFKETEELRARLFRDKWLFVVLLVVLLASLGLCASTLVWGTPSDDDKKWLQTVIAGIITGGLGYVTGKATK